MEIDKDTGLPQLPTGWRWLVEKIIYSDVLGFTIHIRDSYGDLVVYREVIDTATEEAIFDAARLLYRDWEAEKNYGMYPPKRIVRAADADYDF